MKEGIKRLFFGVELHAPWPPSLPKGRMLDESHRHLTLDFLGNIPFEPLLKQLEELPKPKFLIGTVGNFDECLILPKRHPRVVAWHAKGWESHSKLHEFQMSLSKWLVELGLSIDERPWLPHATICRMPFLSEEWINNFKPLPFYISSIHLYESIGNLTYLPIWTLPIQPPFIEIEHTADMAFIVCGANLKELYHHAFAALAFKAPELLDYFDPEESVDSLVDIIIALNGIICRADAAVGCPMKAVSFHGEIVVQPNSLLQWEMIVDV